MQPFDKSARAPLPKPGRLEWDERVHPCVLIEARRALRSIGFVVCFGGMHLLILAAFAWKLGIQRVIYPDLPDQLTPNAEVRRLFWMTVMPFFVTVLPGVSMFALSRDIKAGTVELLMLTRLDGYDLIWGKWMALLLAAILMACTMMPYVVLHFFTTGSNPVDELAYLAMQVLMCGIFCAVGVSLSIIRNWILRALVAVIVLVIGYPLIIPAFSLLLFGMKPSAASPVDTLIGLICYGLSSLFMSSIVIFIALSAGAESLKRSYQIRYRKLYVEGDK